MRRRVFSVIAVVCLGLCVGTWRIAAQAPAAPLRQVAYLKASNPEAYRPLRRGRRAAEPYGSDRGHQR